MDVYYNLDSLRNIANPVITMGSYDGVHAGHKEIIRQINTIAKNIDGESVIITFSPHPREVLFGTQQKLINTLDEKITLLDQQGVDVLIVIPFTLEFGDIEPNDFVKDILVGKIGASKIVIGYDHRFGKANRGDINLLKSLQSKFNFEVLQIPQFNVGTDLVSSTVVREALINGNISDVNRYIGYQYFITCDISPNGTITVKSENKLLPPAGDYDVAVYCTTEPIETTLNISDNGDMKIDVSCYKYNNYNVIIKFIKKNSLNITYF